LFDTLGDAVARSRRQQLLCQDIESRAITLLVPGNPRLAFAKCRLASPALRVDLTYMAKLAVKDLDKFREDFEEKWALSSRHRIFYHGYLKAYQIDNVGIGFIPWSGEPSTLRLFIDEGLSANEYRIVFSDFSFDDLPDTPEEACRIFTAGITPSLLSAKDCENVCAVYEDFLRIALVVPERYEIYEISVRTSEPRIAT